MIFSKATLLGLKSLHVMSLSETKNYHSVTELSTAVQCSRTYLNKVLKVLVKAGLIDSKTGPGKGYIFKKDPNQIMLIEIVQSLEDMSIFNTCFFGMDDCSDTDPCVFHHEYDAFRINLKNKLHNTSIVEATKESWKFLEKVK